MLRRKIEIYGVKWATQCENSVDLTCLYRAPGLFWTMVAPLAARGQNRAWRTLEKITFAFKVGHQHKLFCVKDDEQMFFNRNTHFGAQKKAAKTRFKGGGRRNTSFVNKSTMQ